MNATSRRTNSRISPSNVAAACSASLNFSAGFRLGAYISGPGFSGTAPSRSLLLMVHSYKAQCKLRGSPLQADCRMRLGRPWGRAGSGGGRDRAGQVMHDFFEFPGARTGYQWSLKPALMLLLLVL